MKRRSATRPSQQADDADVHADRLRRETPILDGPVVAFDRLAEALGDGVRLVALGEIRNQEAEFVAAEPRVEILRRVRRPLLRDQVVGPHLFAQQAARRAR